MADEVNTAEIERAILRLLEERGEGKTICPSEVAREIAGSEERSAWEPLMSPVRAVAGRLVEEGKIVVTQRGRVVDGATAKGAIRLRLR
jgi:hypothetical protein